MKRAYKIEEVAEILAAHKETVRELLREGKIEGMKLGTHWRVTEDEIRRILGLQKNQQQGVGEGPQND